ncbi:MAG: prepilin-type N-terminal cleavage/methylation domain-containing protein [Lachnospiraceae bacterium]|nr:prepilin-type N-terminal cleavage/methylation domain-containing protein [Lachnospiraceae bacterium]MBQ9610240.1 prepilin-type N-terminal cleavage/methylation domain-containing protein [Lachnospiraceae bacterium]
MARKNNKGFSIVEIVIAIAILSVLLVPIVTQISQTFKTSRQTKKQQLANDNAIYVMEDFQRASLDELEKKYGNVIDGDASSANDLVENKKNCVVYKPDGSAAGVTVEYTYKIYTLDSVELGYENTEYTRKVIMDDLSASLLSKGYRLTTSSISKDGFIINDEGNTVSVDSDGLITGAICEPADAVQNPNNVNLGNMQNMDSTKVAIIGGNATNFDSQAQSDFYAIAMNKLKEEQPASWEQAMFRNDNDSVLNQAYNLDNTKKITRIYIDNLTDDEGKSYYQVNADVTYYNSSVRDTARVPARWSDEIHYNVYSQKFYMDTCPAIYFEYQPYTAEAVYSKSNPSNNNVIYTSDDYLFIENYVDDASIYLYRPYEDQMYTYNTTTQEVELDDGTTVEVNSRIGTVKEQIELDDGSNINVDSWVFYKNMTGNSTVKIHLCSEQGGKPVKLYTNFKTSMFKTAASEYITLAMDKTKEGAIPANSTVVDFNGAIKRLSEDERRTDRLFTVRVYLSTDESGSNSVSLTGAKGEN